MFGTMSIDLTWSHHSENRTRVPIASIVIAYSNHQSIIACGIILDLIINILIIGLLS